MPGDSGDGLLGMVEVWVLPERRRWDGGGAQESLVFFVRDLRGGEKERVGPNAMDGAFAILTGVRAHEEPARRDLDQRRFDCEGLSF